MNETINMKNQPYTLGLDIGIASVGWCVLGEQHIINLGVRAFDKAETAKEGESLNLKRRMARLGRHRLQHRRARLNQVARLLYREGLIPEKNFFSKNGSYPKSLWQLRVEALERQLSPEEWARVIYHICKHRGFHWSNSAEVKAMEADEKGEGGRVKQGLEQTKTLMLEKNYRSVAEMLMQEFPEAQRNKQGEYNKAIGRVALAEELAVLFSCQRQWGNTHASEALQDKILDEKEGLLWQQKMALSGAKLLKMLGHCTLEKHEYRAPRCSYTAEFHVWLTRLNNLKIVVDGRLRFLLSAERELALPLPFQQASELTYKQLKAKLAGLIPHDFKFAGLSYPSQQQIDAGRGKDPEDEKIIRVKGWHQLRKAMSDAGLASDWQGLSTNHELLDGIAFVLSVYKDDEEVRRELAKLDLPRADTVIEALLGIRFKEFHSLSLKALRKIVPYMQQGAKYDEACIQAGYHHSQTKPVGERTYKYLPSFYAGSDHHGTLMIDKNIDAQMYIPRNPVVLRALNQARKVVNAIIHEYGAPINVHIEMARDLSKPFDERQAIKREQKSYQELNQKIKEEFESHFHQTPKGLDLEKYRLYKEQCGKCAYSLRGIDLHRLLEMGYLEVDHILPYSRSYDDSKNNKALVFTDENRNKGNQTPYEYLRGEDNSEAWQNFCTFVSTNPMYREAKRSRLLRKEYGAEAAEGFRERNLNDTRYICKFFKNYVETYLQLAEGSQAKRCVVLSGQLTNFLRARWGFLKVREESDRHHALDALVVAACSHGMVKKLADWSRRKELEYIKHNLPDPETGEIFDLAVLQKVEKFFPTPWNYFYEEAQARLKIDAVGDLHDALKQTGRYSKEAIVQVKPLFVSRAPQRRNRGAVHKETIYAKHPHLNPQEVVAIEKVENLTEAKLASIIGAADPRNQGLMRSITRWLEGKTARERNAKALIESLGRGKAKRAMTEAEMRQLEQWQALPHKPLKSDPEDGPYTGPVIRSVKVNAGKTTGISIRGGVAANASMIRVDVFTKNKRFYLIPVYVHHQGKTLPDRAIVANKDESEWDVIDETFGFCFSLYPNDLIEVKQKSGNKFGYYSGTNRATGSIDIWAHDRNIKLGKDGLFQSIGVKTALSLVKYSVDILGNIYPAQAETTRQPL